MIAVTYFDGGLHEGVLIADGGAVRLLSSPAPPRAKRLPGVVTGLFTDHHVHLQLVDAAALATSRLGRVIDLGGDPDQVRHMSTGVDVLFAGAFLTAPGGYPGTRSWAPDGSVVEIPDAAGAAAAVAAQASLGARFIKAVLHAGETPTLDDGVFRAIVQAAATHRLPVIAHAEGVGQAQRAATLGAMFLAHTPFSEALTDAEIVRQAASVAWISTVTIHEGAARGIATDNLRRFHAAGGEVLYGTDMGNGEGAVDLRATEVAALREVGLTGVDLLQSLSPLSPLSPNGGEPAGDVDAEGSPRLLFLPDGDPAVARPLTLSDVHSAP